MGTGKKIALLGNNGVGKTALINSLMGEEFFSTVSTHSVKFKTLNLDIETTFLEIAPNLVETDVVSQLKQYRPTITMVLIDPTKEGYINDVIHWSDLLEKNSINEQHRWLIATRCDRGLYDNRLLKELGVKYSFHNVFETSAKNASGIQEIRTNVLNIIPGAEEEDISLNEVALVIKALSDQLCELVAKNADALNQIEWRDLERVVATTLEKLGFKVELTPPAKDGGKDVIASCIVENKEMRFYIEIKHWKKGGRPGLKHISEFIELNVRESTNGGLFLSSSGYTLDVYSQLSEIKYQHVHLGQKEKIVSLCQQYVKRKQGLWVSQLPLPDLLFENTLN
ncbi:MAG: restriction endonuclease [Lewinellaceae bacterium]|nr:restriction endonuclease [Lewinellaceae bacterium]